MPKRFKQRDAIQSEQELMVKAAYPQLTFKPKRLPYVTHNDYLPDFYMGVERGTSRRVYLELKEYMRLADCAKYEYVVASNPHVVIAFMIYRAADEVFHRLAKTQNFWVCNNYIDIPISWWERLEKTDD